LVFLCFETHTKSIDFSSTVSIGVCILVYSQYVCLFVCILVCACVHACMFWFKHEVCDIFTDLVKFVSLPKNLFALQDVYNVGTCASHNVFVLLDSFWAYLIVRENSNAFVQKDAPAFVAMPTKLMHHFSVESTFFIYEWRHLSISKLVYIWFNNSWEIKWISFFFSNQWKPVQNCSTALFINITNLFFLHVLISFPVF